jgi:peptidoglycan/LPS O-acetylase OafA/YrhL
VVRRFCRGTVSVSVAVSRDTAPSHLVSKRIPELDGLRGLAIFLVILCHYIGDSPHGPRHTWSSRLASFLGQGAVGVDLFFVLSGFLIGGILLGSRTSPRYYQTFYLRRFHRIIPLYYSWIVLFGLVWLAAAVFGGSTTGEEFRPATPFWSYFVFLHNYFLRSTPIQALWLVPLWSLAVEEQFYLLAPPLVRNMSTKSLAWFMAAIIPLCLLLRFILATAYGASHGYWGIYAAYFWTPCRADDLALGVLVAIVWIIPSAKHWVQEKARFFYAALVICGALIACIEYWLVKPNSFVAATYGRTLIGIFFVLLMIVLLIDRGSSLAGVFRIGALKELGKISYCVYIIHEGILWTVFKILRGDAPRFDSWPAVGVTVIALAIAIGVAELSWKYFEHPLINRGHRYAY